MQRPFVTSLIPTVGFFSVGFQPQITVLSEGVTLSVQQGQFLAALLKARAVGKSRPPFRYRDFGSLATIGRKRAIFQRGNIKLTGVVAWLLWSTAHIYFLIGFRNRLVVAMSWAWSYVTFQRVTRLITGISGAGTGIIASGDSSADGRKPKNDQFRGAA